MSCPCRPVFVVQGVEDGLFLAPGREGDVRFVTLVQEAGLFDEAEAAWEAANDHFEGRASVHQLWVPCGTDE